MSQYDRLTALDSSFLHMERLEYPMHVGAICVFEGATLFGADGRFRIDEVRALGRRAKLVVDCDNFELGRAATARFFEMVREHERRYVLSSARYATDAFLRRKLGCAFAEAKLAPRFHSSFEAAVHALAEHEHAPVA